MNWRTEPLRSLLPMVGGFVLLLFAAATSVFLSAERRDATFWVRHALEVGAQLNRVQATATDAETGQRGYLLTGRPSYLEPYEAARRELPAEIDELASETADNPAQWKALGSLRSSTADKMSELQKTIDLRSTGRSDDALAEVESDRGKELMAAIRQAIADMHSEETALLERRSTRAACLEETGQAVLLASLILVIAFGALALFDARRRVVALQQSNTRLRNEAAERLAAENQVRQLQKMEAVGQLMGGIAHDFNNMLAIVIGSLELARRRLPGTEHPAVMKCLDNAAEGANRAATLTARLLAISRQQPLEPRVIDVNKLAGGMSELLQTLDRNVARRRALESAGRPRATRKCDRQSGGERARRHARPRQTDYRDPKRRARRAICRRAQRSGCRPVCRDLGDGQRRRDEPRGD
jgi:CHASE3 domain sensor protein